MVSTVEASDYDMQCIHPVYLPKQQIYAPCNNCTACKIARAREWSIRIMHELEYFENIGSFVTLTYSDENLPEHHSLRKNDLTLYFKRLRKNLEGRTIKYFACGEYGPKTERPHYHAIILGLSPLEHDVIKGKCYDGPAITNWSQGHVYIGSVTYDSVRYTADYIQKKYNSDLGRQLYTNTGREYPFQLQSKGIGRRWCEDHREELIENMEISMRGQKVGLPKYYQECLGLTQEEKAAKSTEHIDSILEKLKKRGVKKEKGTYYWYLMDCKKQVEKNLARRASLKDESAKL